MTTIRLTNQRGPLHTQDSRRDDDAVDRIMHGVKNSLGTLDRVDVERIEAILKKYSDGSSTKNRSGITRAGDAAAIAGRDGAARARAAVERVQVASLAYKTFWDGKNAELRNAIRR